MSGMEWERGRDLVTTLHGLANLKKDVMIRIMAIGVACRERGRGERERELSDTAHIPTQKQKVCDVHTPQMC